jgi:hypothetical protein
MLKRLYEENALDTKFLTFLLLYHTLYVIV